MAAWPIDLEANGERKNSEQSGYEQNAKAAKDVTVEPHKLLLFRDRLGRGVRHRPAPSDPETGTL
jgi:hypothetical protein